MTKLWFGGSFNPIHVGHLMVARAVAEAEGYERVVLVPCASPPHKPQAADLADSRHRLGMCQAVATCDSLFEVEPLELNRAGPSYTLDTVRQLRQGGQGTISWLIGADMLQILPKWHQIESLMQECKFVIARRPGYEIDWASLPAIYQNLRSHVIDAPLLQISASEIRQRVAKNRPVRYLVPPEVEQYIQTHALYGSSN